jgi:hypothetical protein
MTSARRSRFYLAFWRRWLPFGLCLIGVVILVADGFDLFGVDAFSAFVGAGLSVALTNVLWRIGIAGNLDRDDEEAARQYLAEHGHWPDEPGRDPGRSGSPG